MSRCIHVYSFVARNHGGIPFSGVCPFISAATEVLYKLQETGQSLHVEVFHQIICGVQTRGRGCCLSSRWENTKDTRVYVQP